MWAILITFKRNYLQSLCYDCIEPKNGRDLNSWARTTLSKTPPNRGEVKIHEIHHDRLHRTTVSHPPCPEDTNEGYVVGWPQLMTLYRCIQWKIVPAQVFVLNEKRERHFLKQQTLNNSLQVAWNIQEYCSRWSSENRNSQSCAFHRWKNSFELLPTVVAYQGVCIVQQAIIKMRGPGHGVISFVTHRGFSTFLFFKKKPRKNRKNIVAA